MAATPRFTHQNRARGLRESMKIAIVVLSENPLTRAVA
jgi:hypothetical protein